MDDNRFIMIPLYHYNHYLNCCVITLDLPHLPASASASASVVPLMMDLVPQFELTAGAGCRLPPQSEVAGNNIVLPAFVLAGGGPEA